MSKATSSSKRSNKCFLLDQLYREDDLTLKSMSGALNVSPQVLSMVINQREQDRILNGFIN